MPGQIEPSDSTIEKLAAHIRTDRIGQSKAHQQLSIEGIASLTDKKRWKKTFSAQSNSKRQTEQHTVRSMTRQNNFDIVRLLLATVVVFYHIGYASGVRMFEDLPRYFSGRLAVEGFFTISGFLIFASYERSNSLKSYFIKRAVRILPGYWLATAFCLYIAFCYGSFHVAHFLFANLTFATFLYPSIPGVFQSNPKTVMNAALWTIKIEVMFYFTVPLIVWVCRRLNRDAVLWTLFAASVAFRVVFANHESLAVQLPGQLSFFIIGALIHYHLPFFEKNGKWLLPVAAILYLVHVKTGWFCLRPLAVSTLTLGAALLLPVVKGPTRWGDFSYGVYVLHWPITMIVVALGLYRTHPWAAVVVTFALVSIGAALSWFFVEKPLRALADSRRNPVPAIISS